MHQVVSLLESGGAVCLPFEDISQFNSLESIEKVLTLLIISLYFNVEKYLIIFLKNVKQK